MKNEDVQLLIDKNQIERCTLKKKETMQYEIKVFFNCYHNGNNSVDVN